MVLERAATLHKTHSTCARVLCSKVSHLIGSGANLASFLRISSGILVTLRVCKLTMTHVLQDTKFLLCNLGQLHYWYHDPQAGSRCKYRGVQRCIMMTQGYDKA